MEYIDHNFGMANTIYPKEGFYEEVNSRLCEAFVLEKIIWGYYPLLIHQNKERQGEFAEKLLEDILETASYCQLPFYVGD